MTRINTNVSSLVAQNRLNRTNAELNTSLTRLSTGLRINTGKDDPAGLIASEALRSDITSINKALSNTQRASQIIATADSALGQVSSLLNDIRGLVVEAANNGALSDDEIAANQLQVDSSLEAINRISQTTTFQGRRLLDGSLDFITKAGTGFGSVADLAIDQANLGSAGQLSVNISISAAATKASLLNTGIAATGTSVAATGSITFGTSSPDTEAVIDISAPSSFSIGNEATATLSLAATSGTAGTGQANATGTLELSDLGGGNTLDFDIAVRAGTTLSGANGNDVEVEINTIASGTSNGSYDANTGVLTLNLVEGLDGAELVTQLGNDVDLNNLFQFSNGSAATSSVRTLTLDDSAVALEFTAVADSAVDGARFNTAEIVVTVGGAAAVSYDETANRLSVTVTSGTAAGALATALQSASGGLFTVTGTGTNTTVDDGGTYTTGSGIVNTTPGTGDVVRSTFATTANLTGILSGGLDGAQAGGFTLTAVDGSAVDGELGNDTEIVYTSGAANEADYDEDLNRLTLTVAAGATIQDIADAISNNAAVSALFQVSNIVNGGNRYNTSNNNAGSPATPFGSGSNTTTGGGFSIEAVNGREADGIVANTTTFTYTSGNTTEATYDADTNTVAVTYAEGATVDDVATAIGDIDSELTVGGKIFQVRPGSVTNGTSIFNPGSPTQNVTETVATAGTNTTLNDAITVTAAKSGAEFNKNISFTTDNSLATGVANASVDTNGNIIITTKNTGDVSLSAINNAINNLDDYNATLTSEDGDGVYSVGTDTAPTIVNLANGNQGGGLDADLVFQLTGVSGSSTLQFDKGAKIEDLVQSINLVKDATGVEASIESGNLKLSSSDYGSKGLVSLEVISEGTGGTFESSLSGVRATGTDVQATVNGYAATGKGNTLSINTTSLSLTLTVDEGSSTSVNFEITGGGALFQLGSDVVSNQQARLGIGSLNTAKLGSAAGRLYELSQGGDKALNTDATGAFRVIDDVINKVTSLRGRLGAFQATTLESNTVSLTDTVANLTEAESSIRDADFAAESARLTRAQILVQSGTSVLGIANQNPQNVLGLLR